MALERSTGAILALYAPRAQQKIKHYLASERVHLRQDPDTGRVHGLVEGSAIYSVEFHPATCQNLFDISCDCPALGQCVHQAVAWLAWVEETVKGGTDRSADKSGQNEARAAGLRKVVGGAAPQGTRAPSRAPAIAQQNLPVHPPAPSSPLDEEEPSARHLRDSRNSMPGFRAVMLAGLLKDATARQTAPSVSSRNDEPWKPLVCLEHREGKHMVRLVLTYLKKNGQPGRIRDWAPDKMSLGPDPDLEPWMGILEAAGGTMELDTLVLLEARKGSPPLPVIHSAGGRPLTWLPAGPLTLTFSPWLQPWAPDQVRYRGHLTMESPCATAPTASATAVNFPARFAAGPPEVLEHVHTLSDHAAVARSAHTAPAPAPGSPDHAAVAIPSVDARAAASPFPALDRAGIAGAGVAPPATSFTASPHTAAGRSTTVLHWSQGPGGIHLQLDNDLLATLPSDRGLGTFLAWLDSVDWTLDRSDLDEVEKVLATTPLAPLRFVTHGKDPVLRMARGEPWLALDSNRTTVAHGQVQSILTFGMSWNTIPGLEAATLEWTWTSRCVVEGTQAVLWQRDVEWEARVLGWVVDILGTGLARNEVTGHFLARLDLDAQASSGHYRAVPVAGPRHRLEQLREASELYWQGTVDDFLRGPGPILLEEGLGLRLGKETLRIRKATLSVQSQSGIDWLDLDPVLVPGLATGAPGSRARKARKQRSADAAEVRRLRAVQDMLHLGMVRDEDGALVILGPGDRALLDRLVAAGLRPGTTLRTTRNNIGLLASLEVPAGSHLKDFERARQLVASLGALDADLIHPVPAGFRGSLRGYQRLGYSWLRHMCAEGLGACLADDMGLGKTVQTLAVIQALAESPGTWSSQDGLRVLLVVPVSTLANWQGEIDRFVPNLGSLVHWGLERPREDGAFRDALAAHPLHLVSYATLRANIAQFTPVTWDLVVLDEAQTIRNPQSQVFKAVRSLKARARVSLTGTPVENSVFDLWSQMDFLNPGILGSVERFRSRWAQGTEGREDPETLRALRTITSPFVLRRRKDQVATDLPPKEEVVVWCELSPAQRAVYQDILDASRLMVDRAVKDKGIQKAGLTILEALLRLRQACIYPGLAHPDWEGAGSAKEEAFLDLVDSLDLEENKVLVFSQFTGVLDKVEDGLARHLGTRGTAPATASSPLSGHSAHIISHGSSHDSDPHGSKNPRPWVRLDGASTHRGDLVARFQNDPACRLFLLSLKAGGVGLNLTAAGYVVLLDPWWNPAAEAQAIDRAHRIGQDHPVIVYRLVARDTVEEKILALQEKKRELYRTLVDDNPGHAVGLGTEDLLALLG